MGLGPPEDERTDAGSTGGRTEAGSTGGRTDTGCTRRMNGDLVQPGLNAADLDSHCSRTMIGG